MPGTVLLIGANRCTTPDAVFPLGLAHVHAALRRAGHEVNWLDCLVNDHSAIEEALARLRPEYVGISLRNIDDVIIRKQETFFGEVVKLARVIRRNSDCSIILGGSGFSLFPERLLELVQADYGICGEGEASLTALLAALENGGELGAIPGLVYRNGHGVTRNPPGAAPVQDGLEVSDRPAWLTRHYLESSSMLNIQTQRGCAMRCCYCTYPLIEGRHHRRRPAELVAEEFAQLEQLGARYTFIVDSVFNSSLDHVAELCEALLRRKLSLKWSCFLRPQGLTPELVRLMARAGLAHAEFGSDSFCDPVLEAYGKNFSFGDILHASELVRREQIDYCHFLICGGPGETWDTLQQSFENSRRLADAVVMAMVGMRIYPGTPLHERALREQCLAPEADLLPPAYYLSPGLTSERVFERLREFARLAPKWVVGDATPAYTSLVRRLRQRGVAGPLWSYFSLCQRLWPQPAAASSS